MKQAPAAGWPGGERGHGAPGETLQVEVVHAPACGPVDLTRLTLPAGSMLAHALVASGVLERHGLTLEQAPVGIWGRRARADTLLRQGDRVEIYRPLLCDPKQARRLRQRGQRNRRGQASGSAARSRSA
jgi:putative ubiquitin-RnfH superfamily antitoxin RatB of RatAB toxin-antitoxin module